MSVSDELTRRKAQLSPAKKALIEQWMDKKQEKARIPRAQERAFYPLSFAQQRLWFLDQLTPNMPLYNVRVVLRLDGPLDIPALFQSIEEIVSRHHILRTTFETRDGQPFQVIAPTIPLQKIVSLVNLEAIPEWERENVALKQAEDEVQKAFHLSEGPLFRSRVLQLEKHHHILVLSMHHIISDGWSLGIVLHELSVLYEARVANRPVLLADLPIQYADFAIWQREWFKGEVLDKQLNYWKKQLDQAPLLLDMPTDHPYKAIRTFQGNFHSFKLSRELSEALQSLSQNVGVTLFMTLFAAFNLLLYLYSNKKDLVVGTAIANRNHIEIEYLVGFFVNTLALRTRISSEHTFLALLAQVCETTLDAHDHQDLPFERLADELQSERDPSHTPICQTLFVLQNTPQEPFSLPGLQIQPVEVGTRTAKFELALSMEHDAEGLKGYFEYSTDLFEASTIKRMVKHFCLLLERIPAHPEQRIRDFSLLSAAEWQQYLVNGQGPVLPDLSADCNHELFEKQALLTPDSVAVVYGKEHLSYEALNEYANQLAHYLQKRGVRSEIRVGLYLERSLELIIGLLGIFKAGGVYVPLDLQHPQERMAFIITDTDLQVIVTCEHFLESLPTGSPEKICIDTMWPLIVDEIDVNPEKVVSPNNLAYIVHTSGSTGYPKGVLIEHRSLSNLSAAEIKSFQIVAESRVLQFVSCVFDVSIGDIFMALRTGATLILTTPNAAAPGQPLIDLLQEQAITAVALPVSVLTALPLINFPTLKTLIVGGESCPEEIVEYWSRNRLFINGYGPTEVTIGASFTPCISDGRKPTIGSPFANIQMYLLNADLQPVVPGVFAEIYLGGIGLARGYVNRADLTAEIFLPHPFSSHPGARLYRTGDYGRYLSDGTIEFMGRIDGQVKVRGLRIETGEIEAHFSRHPAVKQGVVVVRQERMRHKQLIAYVVAQHEQHIAVKQLRSFLEETLPAPMVPAHFVVLDELPLTTNGKVDRALLASFEVMQFRPTEADTKSWTPTERLLARLWLETLKLETVSIHDNFFELGGDSILSIQIISRANQEGLRLSPRQIFQHQTIAALAASAEAMVHAPATRSEQEVISGSIPLTPIQHWFFQQEFTAPDHWNQAALLEVPNDVHRTQLETALSYLFTYHDIVRARFSLAQNHYQQSLTGQFPATIEQFDVSDGGSSARNGVFREHVMHMQASLNITSGPLVRIALFNLGLSQPRQLLIVMHHLLVDTVSWHILRRDLQTVVAQLKQGRIPQLPAKTLSYKEWSQRLQRYTTSPEMQAQVDYWLKLPSRKLLPLPVDFVGGANTQDTTRTYHLCLPSQETSDLIHKVPRVYHTQINDVLLTALVLAYYRWTGQPSLLIALEGHGREEIQQDLDVSRTVGWFTSLFPVMLDIEAQDDGGAGDMPGNVLKAVKEQLRRIPTGGIGYGMLRYLGDVALSRTFEAQPQPEISFNYLGWEHLPTQDDSFKPCPIPAGSFISPLNKRPYLLDITAVMSEGALQLTWAYSHNFHKDATIASFASAFLDNLRQLIKHCLSPSAGGYTPSDFPLAKLHQKQLDSLIGNQSIEGLYPLSPLQQGILFHSLAATGIDMYFEQFSWTIRGQLDIEAFESAWQNVLTRHASLRAAVIWEGIDEPVQIVPSSISCPVIQLDWSVLSSAQQEEQLRAYLEADKRRKVDFGNPPLMRLHLIQLDAKNWKFIWSCHHLLMDGWSIPLVLRDFTRYYRALSQGRTLHLPPLPPYQQYIEWLSTQDLHAAETYWRRVLKGFTTPTPLPGRLPGRGESVTEEAQYEEQHLTFSAEETMQLQRVCRNYQITLNTLFQGAWAFLLSRYSGQEDIVFGVVVSGRPAQLQNCEDIVGLFINTLPTRLQVPISSTVLSWLLDLQEKMAELRQYEYSPLLQIQNWSDVPRGNPLFESIFIFENYPVNDLAEPVAGDIHLTDGSSIERTNYPLTVKIIPDTSLRIEMSYDARLLHHDRVAQMLRYLSTLTRYMSSSPEHELWQIALSTETEEQQRLQQQNDTALEYADTVCIHDLIETQKEQTPDAVALIFEEHFLTYEEVCRRADQISRRLQHFGVGPDTLVGIYVDRSPELVIAILGVLKSGGAYVPLDPTYPQARLAFMLEDAHVAVLITQETYQAQLSNGAYMVVMVENCWEEERTITPELPDDLVKSENLAYVLYTSGSTGTPKGVMVTHRNIVNFFAAMSRSFGKSQAGTWLALTSTSFDVSILELLWPLTQGFQILLQGGTNPFSTQKQPKAVLSRRMAFSLFYFASDESYKGGDAYKLLLEGARFADDHDFAAVWTPERHFHSFGGLYPNPAITSAAIATITQRVQIRAGSVVLPLHDPVRVAEEWSMVDNLSSGRVGISVASGWHVNDFVLAPESYTRRKEVMAREIETVMRLWRGEEVRLRNGVGEEVPIRIYPSPVQEQLPLWMTAASSPKTFELAGEMGANVLTHLLGQSIDEVAANIKRYREARERHGHRAADGQVALMLHTFVAKDKQTVKERVRAPLIAYLNSNFSLIMGFLPTLDPEIDVASLSEHDLNILLSHAADRFLETSGLFGTPADCLAMIDQLKEIGVDEVACLIDFGVERGATLESLHELDKVRRLANTDSHTDFDLLAHLQRHHITHLQCTPSLAAMIVANTEMRSALQRVQHLLLGGEALPVSLAKTLLESAGPALYNMYGPTETTVWSTMYPFEKDYQDENITIGSPVANTQTYILDRHLLPVPQGIAGDLYIGGAGVTRGYFKRPAITAEQFVPDPFSHERGARMYKTGDLARYMSNGTIEFLGRQDEQVKVRGYRIELGEIESILSRHEAVKQAVVVLRENEFEDKRLFAYILPQETYDPSSEELRAHAAKWLPQYMVPWDFILLDHLPFTPNGKLDRQALPLPAPHHELKLSKTSSAPDTDLEKAIAQIWQEVLHTDQVGIDENFFDRGGHSLLLLHVHSKLQRLFHIDLTITDMFKYPTVASLARYLTNKNMHVPQQAKGKREEQLKIGRERQRHRLERQQRFTQGEKKA